MSEPNFSFITDRLAVGNVASRATPGFCAVVSLLATRPWDEVTGAPEVPNGREVSAVEISTGYSSTCVLHIDISDGETSRVRPDNGETYGNNLDDYLNDVTSFIAAHIRRGRVLVHCGAGKSRSAAVTIAYLCRYAGMSYNEAAALVAERRPGTRPAPCFAEAIKRWLRLDELATNGPEPR